MIRAEQIPYEVKMRLRAENERLKRSRDRYRVAWVEEKRRFTAARAAMEEK
jgi:hypothetical protein